MTPAAVEVEIKPTARQRAARLWKKYKWFAIVVLLPTTIVGGYLFAMASDQYESEAHFLVRSQGGGSSSSSGGGGIGAALGLGGGGGASALSGAAEAMSVADYLQSHDVVAALRKSIGLVQIYRRPEIDVLSRLPDADPNPENLLKYYKKQVDIFFDPDTGITNLTVRAFRPEDSYRVARALLAMGEQRINEMNIRGYADAVSLSRRQLDEVERAVTQVQAQMTQFRQSERDVDPEGTATAQIGLASRLRQELSAAEAQLQTTVGMIGVNNPQTAALRQQVSSLRAQLAMQDGRLAGGATAIAAGLGNFERLQMQQELLAKRYDAASTTYENARQQAVRQQLYVVRVVDANMPVKSTYPRRAIILLTVFGVLMVTYAIGWLIAAGVREHTV